MHAGAPLVLVRDLEPRGIGDDAVDVECLGEDAAHVRPHRPCDIAASRIIVVRKGQGEVLHGASVLAQPGADELANRGNEADANAHGQRTEQLDRDPHEREFGAMLDIPSPVDRTLGALGDGRLGRWAYDLIHAFRTTACSTTSTAPVLP